ncbi:hypothetical protein BDR07DRAFT_1403422 [Suillus spraguei]|nr:hypothetical protein BDR07DRAFT_1403422 [Suillus spraguei]
MSSHQKYITQIRRLYLDLCRPAIASRVCYILATTAGVILVRLAEGVQFAAFLSGLCESDTSCVQLLEQELDDALHQADITSSEQHCQMKDLPIPEIPSCAICKRFWDAMHHGIEAEDAGYSTSREVSQMSHVAADEH